MYSCPARGNYRRDRPNVILAYFRDTYDGYDSFIELLYAMQLLRVAYDSPRIGGGVDPNVAVLAHGDSVETQRNEDGSYLNYLLGATSDPTDAFEGHETDYIQDMIVHAEAVAIKWLDILGEG